MEAPPAGPAEVGPLKPKSCLSKRQRRWTETRTGTGGRGLDHCPVHRRTKSKETMENLQTTFINSFYRRAGVRRQKSGESWSTRTLKNPQTETSHTFRSARFWKIHLQLVSAVKGGSRSDGESGFNGGWSWSTLLWFWICSPGHSHENTLDVSGYT